MHIYYISCTTQLLKCSVFLNKIDMCIIVLLSLSQSNLGKTNKWKDLRTKSREKYTEIKQISVSYCYSFFFLAKHDR